MWIHAVCIIIYSAVLCSLVYILMQNFVKNYVYFIIYFNFINDRSPCIWKLYVSLFSNLYVLHCIQWNHCFMYIVQKVHYAKSLFFLCDSIKVYWIFGLSGSLQRCVILSRDSFYSVPCHQMTGIGQSSTVTLMQLSQFPIQPFAQCRIEYLVEYSIICIDIYHIYYQ